MTNTVQEFLAAATQKATDQLMTSLEGIPAAKRAWKPTEAARSGLDQVAECAIINGIVADTLASRTVPSSDFMAEFVSKKALLAQDENEARRLLATNTALVVAAIQTIPSEDLENEIAMPWGPMTLRALCTYPFWNMTYHQGQMVYIATLIAE